MAFQVQLFDIDLDLKVDPNTNDFKELYDEDTVNQSIDLFLSNPYRIGTGLTNGLFNMLFTDIQVSTVEDIKRVIREEFEYNYPMVIIDSLIVHKESNQRRIRISMRWTLAEVSLSGTFDRYWTT